MYKTVRVYLLRLVGMYNPMEILIILIKYLLLWLTGWKKEIKEEEIGF